MGLKQQIEAALKRKSAGKASADDVLNQITALVAAAETEEPEASEDEEEEEASEEEDDTSAADGAEDEDEAEDDKDEPAAKANAAAPKPGTAAHVLAIMDLPEAKGREALARELAAAGLSLAKAKKALAAAPKKSTFAPQNPVVGAGGGSASTDADARLLAAAERLAKQNQR